MRGSTGLHQIACALFFSLHFIKGHALSIGISVKSMEPVNHLAFSIPENEVKLPHNLG